VSAAVQSTQEVYCIYNIVVDKMFTDNLMSFVSRDRVKQIVIRDRTNTRFAYDDARENWNSVRVRLRELSDETIAGFEAGHKQTVTLEPSFCLHLPYSLLSQEDYVSFFGNTDNNNGTEEYWTRFYKRYPDSGGYVWLSNIGFNKAHDQALVYFVNWCGTSCGSGSYILLKKTSGQWKFETAAPIWIS
jgi:hypothetical protein